MEVTLKAAVPLGLVRAMLCFNPCFNGSDSKSYDWEFLVLPFQGVSILVLMEVTLKVLIPARSAEQPEVSILVLMEVTLKVLHLVAHLSTGAGFNPCFNGSDSKSGLPDSGPGR